MLAEEFSQEFDILYNNISSNQAPGLTEYEKSVFLTKAQDEIIKNYFTGKPNGNKYQEGIEDSAKRYSDFSCLITVASIPIDYNAPNTIDSRGQVVQLPDDLMISLNEKFEIVLQVSQESTQVDKVIDSYQVIPITLGEYQRLMSKPSGDPLKRQVWKLMGNSSTGNGSIEIIPHWRDGKNEKNRLVIRYVRHPYPIILENLEAQDLTINGKQDIYGSTLTPTSNEACELAKELHPEILQRAVELAKVFYAGQPADVINSGQRSE